MPATLTTPARPLPDSRIAASPGGVLAAWHLLSLDAPTVAVLWTAFFARCLQVALPAAELVALFIAVWLLYAADRLLDALPARRATANLQARHFFHHRHRRAFLSIAALASVVLIPLALRLPSPDLRLDLILAAALLFWFSLIHLVAPSRPFPKELTTGLFFAAATVIPTFTRHPAFSLLGQAALFAALCTLNGLFITAWEHGRASPALSLHRGLWAATVLLMAASLGFASLEQNKPALAIFLASAGLLLLDQKRAALQPTTLRAAADLALLTPVIFWPFLH